MHLCWLFIQWGAVLIQPHFLTPKPDFWQLPGAFVPKKCLFQLCLTDFSARSWPCNKGVLGKFYVKASISWRGGAEHSSWECPSAPGRARAGVSFSKSCAHVLGTIPAHLSLAVLSMSLWAHLGIFHQSLEGPSCSKTKPATSALPPSKDFSSCAVTAGRENLKFCFYLHLSLLLFSLLLFSRQANICRALCDNHSNDMRTVGRHSLCSSAVIHWPEQPSKEGPLCIRTLPRGQR